MRERNHPANHTTTEARGSLTILRQDRTRVLIRVAGEWDLANAHLLEELVDEQIKARRRLVRMDLRGVSFLDCTGLGALVIAHQRLATAQGKLMLTGMTPRLTRLLRLAGLDQVLLTRKTRDNGTRAGHALARVRQRLAGRAVQPG